MQSREVESRSCVAWCRVEKSSRVSSREVESSQVVGLAPEIQHNIIADHHMADN